jgi:hypothetical protein
MIIKRLWYLWSLNDNNLMIMRDDDYVDCFILFDDNVMIGDADDHE